MFQTACWLILWATALHFDVTDTAATASCARVRRVTSNVSSTSNVRLRTKAAINLLAPTLPSLQRGSGVEAESGLLALPALGLLAPVAGAATPVELAPPAPDPNAHSPALYPGKWEPSSDLGG